MKVITYSSSQGKESYILRLAMPFMGKHTINFELVIEKQKEKWVPIKVSAIGEEGGASLSELVFELSNIWWEIVHEDDKNQMAPPIIEYWEIGKFLIAACLPKKHHPKTPIQDQIKENKDLDPTRSICWWPNPHVWKKTLETVDYLKEHSLTTITLPFFTQKVWLDRDDIQKNIIKIAGCFAEHTAEEDNDPEVNNKALSFFISCQYNSYLRNLRTQLLCFRKNNIKIDLRIGDVELAKKYFKDTKKDPEDPGSWINATHHFEVMPYFVREEITPSGPLGIIKKTETEAVTRICSILPGYSMDADAIFASLIVGSNHIKELVFWPNPLSEIAFNKTQSALSEELESLKIKKISSASETTSLDIHPYLVSSLGISL